MLPFCNPTHSTLREQQTCQLTKRVLYAIRMDHKLASLVSWSRSTLDELLVDAGAIILVVFVPNDVVFSCSPGDCVGEYLI